jgi:hypothetical protein
VDRGARVSVDKGSSTSRRAGSLVNNPWLEGMLPPPRRKNGAGFVPVDRVVAVSPPAPGSSEPARDLAESERAIGGIQHGTAQAQTG